MNLCNQQLFLLSVTCEGAYFALGIAPMSTGNTPVFLNPLCIFATVIDSLQAGKKISKKWLLAKIFALFALFQSSNLFYQFLLNWAKGVESRGWSIWLVCGGIAIT